MTPYADIVKSLLPDTWQGEVVYTGVLERDTKGHAKTYTVALDSYGRCTALIINVEHKDVCVIPGTHVQMFDSASAAYAECKLFEEFYGKVQAYKAHVEAMQPKPEPMINITPLDRKLVLSNIREGR